MHPVLIQIGPLVVRWYGVMIAMALVTGMWIALKEAKRKGMDADRMQDFFLYAIIGAIVGARVYYVLFSDLGYYWNHPLSVFAVWQGGLAIHGGILGGLLVAVFFTRRQKIPFWRFADTLTPSLVLGQAIGRIGCFLNGDAYGYPTDQPWGLIYAPDSPAGRMFPGQHLHPTQLYEMFFDLIIFCILFRLRKRMKVDGHLFLLYVILYSIIRAIVEYFRYDRLTVMGHIPAAQLIGILGVIAGGSFIFYRYRRTGNMG